MTELSLFWEDKKATITLGTPTLDALREQARTAFSFDANEVTRASSLHGGTLTFDCRKCMFWYDEMTSLTWR
jgi:hypothetical protein